MSALLTPGSEMLDDLVPRGGAFPCESCIYHSERNRFGRPTVLRTSMAMLRQAKLVGRRRTGTVG
jgi:hypothetical protein